MRLFNIFNKRNNKNYFIELIDTHDEYKDECKEIIFELIGNLKEFHYMEKKAFKKSNSEKTINNFISNKKEKLKLICTSNLYDKISVVSVGKPTQYEFLINDCKISATMKSNKKIEVYFKFNYTPKLEKIIKYEMKNDNGNWLLNKKQYKFKTDTEWNNDRTF